MDSLLEGDGFEPSVPLLHTILPPATHALYPIETSCLKRAENKFAANSLLEGDGFELSVPLRATAPAISFPEIRNPFSST